MASTKKGRRSLVTLRQRALFLGITNAATMGQRPLHSALQKFLKLQTFDQFIRDQKQTNEWEKFRTTCRISERTTNRRERDHAKRGHIPDISDMSTADWQDSLEAGHA